MVRVTALGRKRPVDGFPNQPKFFSIQGTLAKNFHYFCHFAMSGVTEIVKKAFAISTRFFTYCVTRQKPSVSDLEGRAVFGAQVTTVVDARGRDVGMS